MKPHRWYEIRNVADDSAELWLYEQIGADFWGEGITSKQFAEDLAALSVSHIDLHINSPGGQVFEAQAIYTVLTNHPASITSYIDGLAASCASFVALAGDHVVMSENALFMVHNPSGAAIGTAQDMRSYADLLDKVRDSISAIYVAKTGKPLADVEAAMDAETWYDAAEAQAFGFVDEVAGPIALAADASWDLAAMRDAGQLVRLGYKGERIPTAHVQNAGRVLSAKNESDLKDARDLLQGVIDQVDSEPENHGTEPAAEASTVEAAEAEPVLIFAGGRPLYVHSPRKEDSP